MAVKIRDHIQFLLNGVETRVSLFPANQTLLDYLRLERKLTGSKEGCAEGDCGACSVLVGRLVDGALVYEAVNACIRFMGSLDGCHVVTVEHLKGKDGTLHPVQQAMVDHHGSQCGFCTPGIVMSLYGLWMENPDPSVDAIEVALQGNLCRCTGYAPIIRAAQAIAGSPVADILHVERAQVTDKLKAMADGRRVECGLGEERVIVPASSDDLADVLAAEPKATIVAGSTDVGLWVTKFLRDVHPAVFIGNIPDLQTIKESAKELTIGAGVTYTQAAPHIVQHFPQMAGLWNRIGGAQVRNMGTVGGNIANGSPIGDTPPPLIALGASIVLRKGKARRTVRLEDFFIAYGKQDRAGNEFVESIIIPKPGKDDRFAVYKISKRRDEDISSVCGAFRVRSEKGMISEAVIAFGGMAATPKRAPKAEAALVGKKDLDEAAIAAATAALAEDYQPISDMRASAEYRMLVAQNLLRRFFIEGTGEPVQISRGAA
jgi:xanthine dehydrogenase small subunit